MSHAFSIRVKYFLSGLEIFCFWFYIFSFWCGVCFWNRETNVLTPRPTGIGIGIGIMYFTDHEHTDWLWRKYVRIMANKFSEQINWEYTSRDTLPLRIGSTHLRTLSL